MRRRVARAKVRLDLDDTGAPDGSGIAEHEDLPQKIARHLERGPGVERPR
jgi:hypothetical protein